MDNNKKKNKIFAIERKKKDLKVLDPEKKNYFY